ncbi:MAG: hypothetical protein A2W26_07685 [Acidobacteria bacterium RBG_16_64_8]|nr:MAG: hypothetical protein A2W26_07685 [Acidobacteria bacterium RBG_16_64_8]
MIELTAGQALTGKLIEAGTGTLVLKGGRLIDGTGRPPLANGVVVIEGERITKVGPVGEVVIPTGRDVRTLDTAGKVLMPGLIECHIHLNGEVTFDAYRRYLAPPEEERLLRSAADAARMLEAGFTTLRDVGSKFAPILKRAARSGILRAPRIFGSGQALTVTGGHGDWLHFPYAWVRDAKFRGWIVDGADECRHVVRLQFREGADLVKIIASGGGITNTPEDLAGLGVPEFSPDELRAIVEEARMRRAKVAAHTTGAEATRQAIAAGVDTIEHGMISAEHYDVLDTMAERGVILDPTMAIMYRAGYDGDRIGVFKGGQEAARRVLELQQRMVDAAKRRGVTVVLGTDCIGSLGAGESALELRLLVDSGLSTMEAIVAGTRNGAIALGAEKDLGTLEPGKVADVLVLNKDPLADIKVLEDTATIAHVIQSRAPIAVRI